MRDALHTVARATNERLAQVREFLYGLIGYEFAHTALEERGALETLFMLITLGDLIGVPILPPYYALRILPYAVPNIAGWKRRVLRERMPTDAEEFDLHVV
ncbi:MAG: hypothetical protein HZB53_02875 [Chloroflexi bacterium]|nr:hypothetical protein [Chloroflexota bacterium]